MSLKTPFQKWFQRRQNVFIDIASLMGNQCGGKGITPLLDRFHWGANRPQQITNKCMPGKKRKKRKRNSLSFNMSERFMAQYEQQFCSTAYEYCFVFCIHPLLLPHFFFSLTLIFCSCCWQRMVMTGRDGSLIDLSWAAQWEEGSLLTL